MKRIIALLLSVAMILSGCSVNNPTQTNLPMETEHGESSPGTEVPDESTSIQEADSISFSGLDDDRLLPYIEDLIYTELVETLDPEMYYIEGISAIYISKEYLEELSFNSQSNIFFGYTLDELNAQFEGNKYVFTLAEDGQTTVKLMEEIPDDTYDRILRNVAIGTGIILVCVTVAVVTKNPASAVGAGKAIRMIYAASSSGAKSATIMATSFAGIGGTTAALLEGYQTQDMEQALKQGALVASEGFKWGAFTGSVSGIASGIKQVGNTRYFAEGTAQAAQYSQGVEFTKGPDGNMYPRFEKWAKATANFDTPTVEAAMNHTGLSGNYYWDAKLANAQCGFASTPAGYVWHHVENMKSMILVPQDLHSIAFGGMSHTGGASLIRTFLGI